MEQTLDLLQAWIDSNGNVMENESKKSLVNAMNNLRNAYGVKAPIEQSIAESKNVTTDDQADCAQSVDPQLIAALKNDFAKMSVAYTSTLDAMKQQVQESWAAVTAERNLRASLEAAQTMNIGRMQAEVDVFRAAGEKAAAETQAANKTIEAANKAIENLESDIEKQDETIALLQKEIERLRAIVATEAKAAEEAKTAEEANAAEEAKAAEAKKVIWKVSMKNSTKTYISYFVDKEAAEDFVARARAADALLRGKSAEPYVELTIKSFSLVKKGATPTWG